MKIRKEAKRIHGYWIDRKGPEKAKLRAKAVAAANRLDKALRGTK